MSNSNSHGDRMTVIPGNEHDWPRDFDFRAAYAEQRELLDVGFDDPATSTVFTRTERNDQ